MTIKIFSVINLSQESPQTDSVITSAELAFTKIKKLLADGADFVDIGGRSSGAKTLMIDDVTEQSRLKSVFDLTKEAGILPLSLDTWSPETAIKYLDNVQVLNYTSTYFPEHFLQAVSETKCKLILNYSSAKDPYALRSTLYKSFNINEVVHYFESAIELLQKKGINVLAIDPNLGVWHSGVANTEKPLIQQKIIDYIPVLKKIAPVFIVAPRIITSHTKWTLNLNLTKLIIEKGVDFIRTHDLEQVKACLLEG